MVFFLEVYSDYGPVNEVARLECAFRLIIRLTFQQVRGNYSRSGAKRSSSVSSG